MGSDKKFHIIREHPAGHSIEICGGMWGSTGGAVPDMEGLVREYLKGIDPNSPGIDQLFLRDIIYPQYASHSSFVHDQ
jgi:hypothetical protein